MGFRSGDCSDRYTSLRRSVGHLSKNNEFLLIEIKIKIFTVPETLGRQGVQREINIEWEENR